MHYDFIEIGTSDFDTLIENAKDTDIGLSVDPMQIYLDKLPDNKGGANKDTAILHRQASRKLKRYI